MLGYIGFIRKIWQVWVSEKPNQMAAALAYFGMFSFAAVIYIAYLVAGIFINSAAAAQRFYTRIAAIMGPEIAEYIQNAVNAISTTSTGGSWIISLISLGSLLFVAMGLFLQLKYALNRIWGVPLVQRGQRFALIRQQFFAFIMVIALGLLVILATLVNVIFAWFGAVIQELTGGGRLIPVLNAVALLCIIALANAFTYKFLPDVKIAWRDVWSGSAAAALLMALGGLVLGLYFRLGGVHSAFQAAGTFAVLMISIYIFAQIFLFGAVVTRVYAQTYGSLREPIAKEGDANQPLQAGDT
jgi:membrane protein